MTDPSTKKGETAPPTAFDVVMRVEQLHKFYGKAHVLRGVDLTVHSGEVLAVIGPSGSGKSTLLRCLNRLEDSDRGHIWLDGMDITHREVDLARVRTRVGMIFQHLNLFPHMSALRNVMEGPTTVLGLSRDEAAQRATKLLDRVGLANKADARPAQLSGGEQQRVAIARALAMQPAVLLFDEVTSALDPELIGEVLNVIKGLAEDGMTMIVVTHEMNFAERVADRLLMFDEGLVIEEGRPAEIFRSAQHERTRRFLSQLTWNA